MNARRHRLLTLSLIAVVVGLYELAAGVRLPAQPIRLPHVSAANEVEMVAAKFSLFPPHRKRTLMAASLSDDKRERGGSDDPRRFLEGMAEATRNRRPTRDPVVRYAVSRGLIRSASTSDAVDDCPDPVLPPQRPECR